MTPALGQLTPENHRFLSILFTNPYVLKRHDVPLSLPRKLVLLQHINQGLSIQQIYIQPAYLATLFAFQLLSRKPKRWIHHNLWVYAPLNLALQIVFWTACRWLYPNQIIDYTFSTQKTKLADLGILDNKLFYEKIQVENRITLDEIRYQKKSTTAREKSIDWIKGQMQVKEKQEDYQIDRVRRYNKNVMVMDEELMRRLEKQVMEMTQMKWH